MTTDRDILRRLLDDVWSELENGERPSKFGNAPGHCHEKAGVWDSDNIAEYAGKPCDFCATWNAAVFIVESEKGETKLNPSE